MVPTNDKQRPKGPPAKHPETTDRAGAIGKGNEGVQGEGNYDAARRFNETERQFVASGRVDEAARAAAPKSEAERQEMTAAEQAGKRRAKEEDPALIEGKAGATLRKPTAKSDTSK